MVCDLMCSDEMRFIAILCGAHAVVYVYVNGQNANAMRTAPVFINAR